MIKTRSILQLCVVACLALGAGACQTISDLDPTGLLSDSSPTPDSQFPAGAAPQTSDATVGTTPDLASIPAAPVAPGAAQQQQTVQSINADGAQARYSADALRGGTEAAAPAPGAADTTPLPQVASNPPPLPSVAPSAGMDAPPTTDNPVTDAPPTAGSAAAAVPAAGNRPVQTAAIPPPATESSAQPPSAQPPSAQAPSAQAPSAQAASSVPPGAEPAVPADTPIRGVPRGRVSGGVASDAELGFQSSKAPALDASINQWVPPAIVAHYRQTASNAGVTSAVAAVPQKGASAVSDGAVVANLGAIPAGPASVAAINGGNAPTAMVYFPGDGTTLVAAARTQIRAAVQAYKSGGGTSTIRVVGHASSRTANMPVEKHLELVFNKSQARANAVAQELIHQGVPADKVLVEAVGDSQPVYYESMPKGEEGNRRADIFVQS